MALQTEGQGPGSTPSVAMNAVIRYDPRYTTSVRMTASFTSATSIPRMAGGIAGLIRRRRLSLAYAVSAQPAKVKSSFVGQDIVSG
jgi:hypothetical protein